MRLSPKTMTILDIPVSRGELVLLVTLCVAGSLVLGTVLRLVCGLALRAWGGAA